MTRSLTAFVLALLTSVAAIATLAAEPPDRAPMTVDPHQVVGYDKCAKCHQAEVTTWHQTPHCQTFETLHRKPEATAIAKRLGFSSIKRNDVCLRCHYTQQATDTKTKIVSGVSCESCHGPAQEWLSLHADYGGPNATRDQESSEHKEQRRKTSIAKGMRNPTNIYLIARSCFNCHTAPDEKLVNEGGHHAGTLDFELVAWSQGKVRHNFVSSQGQRNDVSSPDRLRVMFIVGLMTDLEFSLRATAIATQRQTFGVTNAHRADRLRKELAALQQTLHDPLLDNAVATSTGVKLKLNNQQYLLEAADVVGQAAYDFAEQRDGSSLSAIDSLLPSPNQYR